MTTNLTPNTVALNVGWLDTDAAIDPKAATVATFTANTVIPLTVGGAYTNTNTALPLNTNYYSHALWYYPYTGQRPIRLGMSEVAKLRQAAKRDAKLKAILEKFTDQIEVVVDFE